MRKSSPRYFLGIDGGGTRTVSWLADERGQVCARAVAGPSNPLKVGIESSQRELAAAARGALRKAGVTVRRVEALCAGVAGVDRSVIHRKVLAALRREVPARRYLLTTDAAITLQSAFRKEPGVVVISGTGSIAYGRDGRGRTLRVGGWGAVFDDAGSGYDLGRKAVAAALRDFDGRGPQTTLRGVVLQALKINSITQVAAREWAPNEIAALFPVVLQVAHQGDRVAQRLCEEAGRDLAEMAAALLTRLDPARRSLPVVCAGGVFSASIRVRQSFARHLRESRMISSGAKVRLLRREPVEGALELAAELAISRTQLSLSWLSSPGEFRRSESAATKVAPQLSWRKSSL